jgi:hypothetical protein
MSMFNNLSKSVKSHHLLVLLGLVVLGVVLMQYSGRKSLLLSGMENKEEVTPPVQESSFGAAAPKGQNSGPASVNGTISSSVSAPSCSQKAVADPKDLLPNDSNNEWASLNPSSDLKNVSLLNAGHHAGINTVGGSLRNANLQVRSEPANPKMDVSPWQNSTIEPDLMRQPFEIGCGAL